MLNAYFSNIRHVLIEKLKSADTSIKVAVCWITSAELLNMLIEKARAHVRIELITVNDLTNIAGKLLFQHLIEDGGDIYFAPFGKLMHNKYCIIDNKILITGSYNWTDAADSNEENVVIIESNQSLVEAFATNFNELKSRAAKCINRRDHLTSGSFGYTYAFNDDSLAVGRVILQLAFGKKSARVVQIKKSPNNKYHTILNFDSIIDTDLGRSVGLAGYIGIADTKIDPCLDVGELVEAEILSYFIGHNPAEPQQRDSLIARCRLLSF